MSIPAVGLSHDLEHAALNETSHLGAESEKGFVHDSGLARLLVALSDAPPEAGAERVALVRSLRVRARAHVRTCARARVRAYAKGSKSEVLVTHSKCWFVPRGVGLSIVLFAHETNR